MKEIFEKLEELDKLIHLADFSKFTAEEKEELALYLASLRTAMEESQIDMMEEQIKKKMTTASL